MHSSDEDGDGVEGSGCCVFPDGKEKEVEQWGDGEGADRGFREIPVVGGVGRGESPGESGKGTRNQPLDSRMRSWRQRAGMSGRG